MQKNVHYALNVLVHQLFYERFRRNLQTRKILETIVDFINSIILNNIPSRRYLNF